MSSIEDPTDEQCNKLISFGETLHKRVTSDHNFQPVLIEFAGSPKSGKSTNIDILHHFFRRIGFKVCAPTEGVSKRTPYHLKDDLMAYNSWALCYAISSLLVGYYNVDKPHIVMLDRGPFDSLAWMRYLREKDKLSKEDYNTINKFVTLEKWGKLVDCIYLFTCDPKISLQRESASKLIIRPGRAMNTEMLSSLKVQYEALQKEMNFKKIFPVDTTETNSPKGTSYSLANEILTIMQTHLDSRSKNV